MSQEKESKLRYMPNKGIKTKLDTRIKVPKIKNVFKINRFKISEYLNNSLHKDSNNSNESLPTLGRSNSQIRSLLRNRSNLKSKLTESDSHHELAASNS